MMDKRGSYIVEACAVIPVFFIAMMMLICMIPAIEACGKVMFGASEEMRFEMGKSALRSNPGALPVSLSARGSRYQGVKAVIPTSYKYRFQEEEMSDLISISFTAYLDRGLSFPGFAKVDFKGTVVGRACTGTYYNGEGGTGEPVIVFPRRGRKYHNGSCTYVVAGCHRTFLSQVIKKSYHHCPLCGSRLAPVGAPVYLFEKYGKSYHLGNCNSVSRYYVTIRKDVAETKGYGPCSKCGG